MNELIRTMAVNCHLMNYVDLETPRHYFVRADIDEEDIEMFALQCVKATIDMLGENIDLPNNPQLDWYKAAVEVQDEFIVENNNG